MPRCKYQVRPLTDYCSFIFTLWIKQCLHTFAKCTSVTYKLRFVREVYGLCLFVLSLSGREATESSVSQLSVGDDSLGSWSNLSFEDEHPDDNSSFLHLSDRYTTIFSSSIYPSIRLLFFKGIPGPLKLQKQPSIGKIAYGRQCFAMPQ